MELSDRTQATRPALGRQKEFDPSQNQDHQANPSDQSASKVNNRAVMIIPMLDQQLSWNSPPENQLNFVINSAGQKMAIMKTISPFARLFHQCEAQLEKSIAFEKNMIQTFSKNNRGMIQLIPEEEIRLHTAYSGTCEIKNLETNKVSDLELVAHASLDDSNEPSLAANWSVITEYAYPENTSRFFLEVGEIDLRLKLGKEPVSFKLRCHYMEQILTCIDIMSTQNIAHRDIKLSNFVVFKNQQIKVIDLEHACIMNESGYSQQSAIAHAGGTPNFLSPEQLLSFIDNDIHVLCNKTDVWSAGITFILVILPNKTLNHYIQEHATTQDIMALANKKSTAKVLKSLIFKEYQLFLNKLFDQLKQCKLSAPYITLLTGMLKLNIKDRWSATQVLDFFQKNIYKNDQVLCSRRPSS